VQLTAIIVWVYGALVLAGGVMGYRKAQSTASLTAGLVFGISPMVSGAMLWGGRRQEWWVAIGLTEALLIVMGVRYVKTRKFMPAGLMCVLSVAVLVALAVLK